MMLSLALSLLAGPQLEEVALADICGDDAVCYEAESYARGRLRQTWESFSPSTRESCLSQQEDIVSYRALEVCLIIEGVLTAPPKRQQNALQQTEARIDLRRVSIQGSIHAD
ncbi:hypothetical protein [Hyphobacterium sp.]|uniref:hypothetical protein n=1 Tax=Hyphobacterium sp. TaxID=2004662 RepID=UPI003BAA02D5